MDRLAPELKRATRARIEASPASPCRHGRETAGSSLAGPVGRTGEAATNLRTTVVVLACVAFGCSIPVGGIGDLRLVPSVRRDDLATSAFSAGSSIMGLNLGVAVGTRCLGLVSSMQGNGRCVGVGVRKPEEEEQERKEIAARATPLTDSDPAADGREKLAAVPPLEDDEDARGVSGGVRLFGLGLGVSVSGRCAGITTDKDGNGRCLGVGLRPEAAPEAAPSAPGRTARTPDDVPGGAPAPAR